MDVSTRAVTAVRSVPLTRSRLLAVDWLRGLVMLLMTVDHSSGAFNHGRLKVDSAQTYVAGTVLPAAQFFTRWMTHLCAPTFVFLSGLALFMSVGRRRRDGASERDITGFIVVRGLIIAALDPLWMVAVHRGQLVMQVLYAIGVSVVAMAFLRRLPAPACGALGLLIIVLHEALATALGGVGGVAHALVTFALVPGKVGPFVVLYPCLPWLAVMLLGWAGGDLARRQPERFQGRLLLAGLVALATFVVVRGLNGYGNSGVFRESGSLIQWLHTAKYPASLSYLACELGIAWLLLAALWTSVLPRWAAAVVTPLGQSAFFFYLLHAHLLWLAAWATGTLQAKGLAVTYLAAAAVVALLLPLCERFRRYKVAHPGSVVRYI